MFPLRSTWAVLHDFLVLGPLVLEPDFHLRHGGREVCPQSLTAASLLHGRLELMQTDYRHFQQELRELRIHTARNVRLKKEKKKRKRSRNDDGCCCCCSVHGQTFNLTFDLTWNCSPRSLHCTTVHTEYQYLYADCSTTL